MAQKVLVQLVDDLDGTAAADVTTVLFGLDGVSFEIDLTDANANRLRESLADYVNAARKTGGRAQRNTRPGNTDGTDAARKRAWAIAEGYDLAPRGRIPAHIDEAYHNAMATSAKKASPTPTKRSRTDSSTPKTPRQSTSGKAKTPPARKPAKTRFSA